VAGDFYGQATTALPAGGSAGGSGLYGLAGVLGGAWRGEERCVGWTEVACTAPALGAGVVSVEVSWAHGSFSRSGVEFEYRAEATVAHVAPGAGPASGGSVVTVEGSHLGEDGLLCRFGSGLPAGAQFVSTAVARCEAAGHAEGVVAVEVSQGDEGQQYSRGGVAFEYVTEALVGGVLPQSQWQPQPAGDRIPPLHPIAISDYSQRQAPGCTPAQTSHTPA
jgi:hypothetical protein